MKNVQMTQSPTYSRRDIGKLFTSSLLIAGTPLLLPKRNLAQGGPLDPAVVQALGSAVSGHFTACQTSSVTPAETGAVSAAGGSAMMNLSSTGILAPLVEQGANYASTPYNTSIIQVGSYGGRLGGSQCFVRLAFRSRLKRVACFARSEPTFRSKYSGYRSLRAMVICSNKIAEPSRQVCCFT